MLDVQLENTKYGFDIATLGGDIAPVDDFRSSIIASLFSDARADASQVAIPQYRRGWIGDSVLQRGENPYGSLLWLLEQARLTQDTLNKAIDYARQSLQWFVSDGLASSVDVEGEISRGTINLAINITTIAGNVESHYVDLWENTRNAN